MWKHIITPFLNKKKIWFIVERTKAKLVDPIGIEITIRTPTLLIIGVRSTSDWVECDNLTFTIIHNYLNNSVISQVDSKLTSNKTWLELIQIFESKDAIKNIY